MLIPNPEGHVDRHDWRIPVSVIGAAEPPNLARALVRYQIMRSYEDWRASENKRTAGVLRKLWKRLPEELRNTAGE